MERIISLVNMQSSGLMSRMSDDDEAVILHATV